MIDQCLDHPFFSEERMLSKDYVAYFSRQTPEKQSEILERFAKAIDEIEDVLSRALEIAKGLDPLNE